jgi:hypothetical protein
MSHLKETDFGILPLGITIVVCILDIWAALTVGAVLITFILATDTIFSVIITYIFLKPVLEVLQAAGGRVHTAASRRLERTKRWNFAGVLVTVGSSTVLYLNLIGYFVLTSLRQYALHSSVWGNPFTFGLAVNSILNTLGMVLLCGMFKDVSIHPLTLTAMSDKFRPNKVRSSKVEAAEDPRKELDLAIDSRAYSSSAGNGAFGVQSGDVAAPTHYS